MIDYFLLNFNWFTFFFALGVFTLVSSLLNVISAQISLRLAKEKVRAAEAAHQKLADQLAAKEKELTEMLSTKKGK